MKNAHFLWAAMLSGSLFLPMTSGLVRAVEAPVVALTPSYLNLLAEEMRTNNAALRAAGSRAEAAEFNTASIRSWEDPTFKLGGTVANPRGPKLNEEGDLSYGIEQPLPLFGKPQAARKVAETEIESVRMEADYQFQARRLELARAMFKLALTDHTVAVGEQDLQWLDQMISVAEEKYRAGSASQVDVLRMQNERSRRLNQLELERNDRLAGVAM
ncbi:MAG TPA: TolC family protein, partial [Roseimicrobium sp.]|nr:TolC family protein [Roseimicrobium sp.]